MYVVTGSLESWFLILPLVHTSFIKVCEYVIGVMSWKVFIITLFIIHAAAIC